jgi:hypothetical protein
MMEGKSLNIELETAIFFPINVKVYEREWISKTAKMKVFAKWYDSTNSFEISNYSQKMNGLTKQCNNYFCKNSNFIRKSTEGCVTFSFCN